jgi:hypothetical protein
VLPAGLRAWFWHGPGGVSIQLIHATLWAALVAFSRYGGYDGSIWDQHDDQGCFKITLRSHRHSMQS